MIKKLRKFITSKIKQYKKFILKSKINELKCDGLTYKEIAMLTGVSKSTVGNYINGYKPKKKRVETISTFRLCRSCVYSHLYTVGTICEDCISTTDKPNFRRVSNG